MNLSTHPSLLALVFAVFTCLPIAAAAQVVDRKWIIDPASCPALGEFPATARNLDPDIENPSVELQFAVTAEGKVESVTVKNKGRFSVRFVRWLERQLRTCTFTYPPSAGAPVASIAVMILRTKTEPEMTVGNGKLRCNLSAFTAEVAYANHGSHVVVRVKTGPDSVPLEATVEEASNSESLDRSAQKLAMSCKPTPKALPNESILVKLHLQS